YLIVFGIPSIDIEARRRRRDLQRTTCWQFPGVARRANNFNGAMLVLYVLARHPSHGYNHSAALLEETDEYHDVVTLRTSDALPTTNKTVGTVGPWGTEAGISISRKVYLWFDLALRVFPNVAYIAKGDDDMFLRVPQFLADLLTLPRRRVYWGMPLGWSVRKRSINYRFRYAAGMCYTLSRDVAQQFVSYKPLQRLVEMPYSKMREPKFLSLNMQDDDMMVGRVLRVEQRHHHSIFVVAAPCSFHDILNDTGHYSVTWRSVVIHHLREDDYGKLMERFGNDTTHSSRLEMVRGRGYIQFVC
ncbi:UDP-Gal or UDP-GlcNAc-dependent glycosyltransferase, partial [Trypanosoma theileri]